MSAAYAKLPVHVIGSDPGVCAAYNGGTHMPFEDCALYMSVPEAVVIDPVDYAQINCLTKKLAASGKFSYMRMIRKGFTTVYGDGSDFEIGKGVTLKEGKDVAIIASGIMVDEALKAQERWLLRVSLPRLSICSPGSRSTSSSSSIPLLSAALS